jgi:hypothetical protein
MTSERLQLWDLPNAATELKVNVQTLRDFVKAGELQTVFIGKRYMVCNEDLLAFIEWRREITATCGCKKSGELFSRRGRN